MKQFSMILGIVISTQAWAITQTTCSGQTAETTVTYQATSYRPCNGPCVGAPDPKPIVRVMNKATGVEVTSRVGRISPDRTMPLIKYSKDTVEELSAQGTVIGTQGVTYYKELLFGGSLFATITPGGNIQVSCTTKVDADSFSKL